MLSTDVKWTPDFDLDKELQEVHRENEIDQNGIMEEMRGAKYAWNNKNVKLLRRKR